jgi:hypothetical protein
VTQQASEGTGAQLQTREQSMSAKGLSSLQSFTWRFWTLLYSINISRFLFISWGGVAKHLQHILAEPCTALQDALH